MHGGRQEQPDDRRGRREGLGSPAEASLVFRLPLLQEEPDAGAVDGVGQPQDGAVGDLDLRDERALGVVEPVEIGFGEPTCVGGAQLEPPLRKARAAAGSVSAKEATYRSSP